MPRTKGAVGKRKRYKWKYSELGDRGDECLIKMFYDQKEISEKTGIKFMSVKKLCSGREIKKYKNIRIQKI